MTKEEQYQLLLEQAQSLLTNETDIIANCSNLSALLFELKGVSYAGFYRYQNDELILGPFQGPVACMHIELGKGVCGQAAQTKTTQVVPDVHAFAGHIACDANTNSEIVVPILLDGKLWGVLDLDSHQFNNFDDIDALYLPQIAQLIFGYNPN